MADSPGDAQGSGAAPSQRRPPGWGILGVGKISHDFCVSLRSNGSCIAAVGAREASRAEEFRERFGAGSAFGSYEEVVNAEGVDIVYIGTVHTTHAALARLALQAGKHVLIEKPMVVEEADARELVDLARSRQRFLMEGMWTRFFPAVRKVRALLESGEVGEPRYVQANFGFQAPDDPSSRLWDPAQGGGAMLDVGVYMVYFATMLFGATVPEQIACTGTLTEQGVDRDGVLSLTWEGKGSASVLFTLACNTQRRVTIICSRGSIEIANPAHASERVVVNYADRGPGEDSQKEFKFDLPALPTGFGVNFPNSEGLLYEVQAVEKCLNDGLLECPDIPFDETLAVARIIKVYRDQLGVIYPSERCG